MMEQDDFTILPLPVWILLLVLLTCWPAAVFADPLYRMSDGNGVVITLYDDKCQLTAVSNLPKAATWEEKGKTHTGCWGVNQFGHVAFYFNDRSVVSLPAQYFERVNGA